MSPRAAIMAAACLLAACRTAPQAPPAAPELAVPPAWSVAPMQGGPLAHAPLAAWWARFGDPLLSDLMQQALGANDTLASAQAALRQARALRDEAGAALLPGLSIGASAQHNRNANGSSTSASLGLDAAWEADLFGANALALSAAQANVHGAAATLAAVQVSISAEVALAYIDLRGAQARLAIASENLASQRATLQLTDWRVQAGLLTSLEGEQARAATEQTAAQLPLLEANIARSAHALAVLCGEAPAALAARLAPVMPIPQASDELALSLPMDTLRQRPDVAAAGFQFSAAAARLDQARAARLPSLRLSGSLGLSALHPGGLGSAALARMLLASLDGPLFDGGSGAARVGVQQAQLDQARHAYRNTIATALQEVEDALAALAADRSRLAHLGAAADAAANANLIARQRYDSGLVDFQTVLDVQRSLLTLQDGVASTRAALGADHVRLYKALGGGWQPDAVTIAHLPSFPTRQP